MAAKKKLQTNKQKDQIQYKKKILSVTEKKKKSIIGIMSLDSIGEYINNQQRPSGFRDKSTEKDYENGEKL